MGGERVADLVGRLGRCGVFGASGPLGTRPGDIRDLEARFGVRLPTAYREYLLAMGHSGDQMVQTTGLDSIHALQCRDALEEALAEDGIDFALPPDAFVFYCHEGYDFLYFLTRDGDDPPVWRYLEDHLPALRYPSFTAWLLGWVEAWEGVVEPRRLAAAGHAPPPCVGAPPDFLRPLGVAVAPDGTVVVADTGRGRLVELSPDGVVRACHGRDGRGPGEFRRPRGLAVDRRGVRYVADAGNGRVQALAPDGAPLAAFGVPTADPQRGASIADVAVGPDGAIWVLDARLWQNAERLPGYAHVHRLAPDGRPLASWGGVGAEPGRFRNPAALALDREGAVYVAELVNARVQKLSPDGRPLAAWVLPREGPRGPGPCSGVAVDAAGAVYVADKNGRRVHKLAPSGAVLWSAGGSGRRPGQFRQPAALTLDPDGNLYVADPSNDNVQKLAPDGEFLAAWGERPLTPSP